jgi:hypothetical protein
MYQLARAEIKFVGTGGLVVDGGGELAGVDVGLAPG